MGILRGFCEGKNVGLCVLFFFCFSVCVWFCCGCLYVVLFDSFYSLRCLHHISDDVINHGRLSMYQIVPLAFWIGQLFFVEIFAHVKHFSLRKNFLFYNPFIMLTTDNFLQLHKNDYGSQLFFSEHNFQWQKKLNIRLDQIMQTSLNILFVQIKNLTILTGINEYLIHFIFYRFQRKVFQEKIHEILLERLDGQEYHPENTPSWSREISDEIRNKMKGLLLLSFTHYFLFCNWYCFIRT